MKRSCVQKIMSKFTSKKFYAVMQWHSSLLRCRGEKSLIKWSTGGRTSDARTPETTTDKERHIRNRKRDDGVDGRAAASRNVGGEKDGVAVEESVVRGGPGDDVIKIFFLRQCRCSLIFEIRVGCNLLCLFLCQLFWTWSFITLTTSFSQTRSYFRLV